MQIRRRKYYKNEALLKQIGKTIRRIRKSKNITLQELAFSCNDIDYAYINKVELGQINLSVSYLNLIALKLGVKTIDLLE